jgi:hypothetical protein
MVVAGQEVSRTLGVDAVTVDVRRDAVPPSVAGMQRRFAVWGVVGTLGALVVVLAVSLARTHGHLAYAIDDGGIHLSIARNLGLHGTWGVVPGDFESASSSPLWTVLLALTARVFPRTVFEYMPLLFSAAACVWLIILLAREQAVLVTSNRRVLEITAVVVLPVTVLFVPGLAMTGMEHVLHCALVVQATALFTAAARRGRAPTVWAYAALALAASARYETMFVAAGIGAGLIVERLLGPNVPPLGTLARRIFMVGVAATAPVVVMGLFYVAMGQQFFPNSVIAKSALGGATNTRAIDVFDGLAAIGRDPAVLALFVAASIYLAAAFAGKARRSALPATAVVVAVVLHSYLADYGWYQRYQGYLIALGVFFALGALTEMFTARHATVVAVLILAFALVLAPAKWRLLWETPVASENTYLQRYQAGLFLEHYYNDQPVATAELGYISYFHQGPITDFYGLGDHEVLKAREDRHADPAYWKDLIRKRKVHIVVVYPLTLLYDTPLSWTLVGRWRLDIRNVSGFQEVIWFWAPNKSDVPTILRQLEEWNAHLPSGTHTEVKADLGIDSPLPKMP